MHPLKISTHVTEWGPAKVFLIGPRTCQRRPCAQGWENSYKKKNLMARRACDHFRKRCKITSCCYQMVTLLLCVIQ